MTKLLRPLSPLAVVLLSACSGTPACGDSETLSLLDDIIEEKFEESAYGREFKPIVGYEVRGIRTLDHDVDTDTYECAATLEFSLKNGRSSKTIEQEIEYDVNSVQDKDNDFEVSYDNAIKEGIFKAAMAWSMGWR